MKNAQCVGGPETNLHKISVWNLHMLVANKRGKTGDNNCTFPQVDSLRGHNSSAYAEGETS